MRKRIAAAAFAAMVCSGLVAHGQNAPPPDDKYVTKEEYLKLKAELDAVKADMKAMRDEKAAAPSSQDVNDAIEQLQDDVRSAKEMAEDNRLGDTKLLIAGDAEVGFSTQRKNDSSFDATLSPLMLWQLNDKLLFEGGMDISVDNDTSDGSGETTVDLGIADLTYLLNDYMYAGGGLFVVPFGQYHNHFDPPWINKLPDDPLVFGDREIAPESELGAFVGGAVPITRDSKTEYNAYVSNGPRLLTDSPSDAGTLAFDNYTDQNNNKAVGGRIGLLPIPELDFGYSVQYSKPGSTGSSDVSALLQAVDAEWKKQIEPIQGIVELKGEWVFSHVSSGTYDADGSLGFGPGSYDSTSSGGYLQAAYRPSMLSNKTLRSFEFVVRYDRIDVPKRIVTNDVAGDEARWTFGIDYWITPSVVLKTAYELDHRDVGSGQNALLVQLGIGL